MDKTTKSIDKIRQLSKDYEAGLISEDKIERLRGIALEINKYSDLINEYIECGEELLFQGIKKIKREIESLEYCFKRYQEKIKGLVEINKPK